MSVAERLGTEIISADSRQVYADIPVITAAPSDQDMARVPHHFVRTLPLDAYFSASVFETEALNLLPDIFARCGGTAVVCGGSMMYIDALCNGIDDIPTISDRVRLQVAVMHSERDDEAMLEILRDLDSEYYEAVDRRNIKRVLHAIEICLESGTSYTKLRKGTRKQRDFWILKFMLTAPRNILFDRINRRVLSMLDAGMEEEAKKVLPFRHLNSLNTVGFKEMFKYLDGEWDLDTAIARLQKNTRVYAKKQLTWFARDKEIRTIDICGNDALSHILSAL